MIAVRFELAVSLLVLAVLTPWINSSLTPPFSTTHFNLRSRY